MLVRCTDRSLRPIRHRSARGFVIRRPDQLHDGLEAKALSDRGEPASARAYRRARQTGRPSVRQNTVSDSRDFAFRAGWPPHRADAGDCLTYDVSCPHTIVSPTLTRHEVVIVPKE